MKDMKKWKARIEMKNKKIGVSEILSLFEDEIEISDILASKCMSELSTSIAKKRLRLELTQKEFAEYIQVSQAMVSKWEGGDYNFSIKSLAELAERLDMDLHISLKEYKENIEVNYLNNNEFAYTSFQKNQYVGARSGIISFTEKSSEIYRRREEKIEM